MFIFDLFVEEEELNINVVKGEGGKVLGNFSGWEYFLVLPHIQLGDDDGCYFLDVALEVNDELNLFLAT